MHNLKMFSGYVIFPDAIIKIPIFMHNDDYSMLGKQYSYTQLSKLNLMKA